MKECSHKDCNLEVFENSNKCILHCEKDDWRHKIPYKELEKTFSETAIFSAECKTKLKHFWYIFKQQITEDKVQDFKNIIFPTNAELELKELENKILKFNHCKFTDIFYFNGLNNVQRVEFNSCIFGKSVKFEYIVFKEDFLFQNCVIYKDAELLFKDINFNGVVSFIKTKVKSKFTFTQVRFNDIALFNNSEIEDLFFENTFFRKEVNFLNMKLNCVGNRETARIIKDSFEQQNNIIEANKFYALEMKEREKELEEDKKSGKNIFEWFVFKIHGISSNHSQDWTLALFWIFIVGFIASYYDFNLIQNSEAKYIHYNLSSIFKTIGLIFIILFIDRLCKIKDKFINKSYFIISFYLIYIYATEDYLLSLFSQTINPFSVMKTNDPINGIQLFFKIIIAYLIYQLIISIRQNTRRK